MCAPQQLVRWSERRPRYAQFHLLMRNRRHSHVDAINSDYPPSPCHLQLDLVPPTVNGCALPQTTSLALCIKQGG